MLTTTVHTWSRDFVSLSLSLFRSPSLYYFIDSLRVFISAWMHSTRELETFYQQNVEHDYMQPTHMVK